MIRQLFAEMRVFAVRLRVPALVPRLLQQCASERQDENGYALIVNNFDLPAPPCVSRGWIYRRAHDDAGRLKSFPDRSRPIR